MNKPLHSCLYPDMLRVDIRTHRKIKIWHEEHDLSSFIFQELLLGGEKR